MRKLVLLLLAFSLLIAWGGTASAQSTDNSCATAVAVNSAYGAAFGSGSYSCGASVTFGVSTTVVADGTVRYVFSGWSCSGAGCYSGSADTASLTAGGNNTVITETAQWITEYLLTISSNPSGGGSTNPGGSFWEIPDASVTVTQSVTLPNWFFVYWSLDGQNAGSSASSFTVTMDSPHSLAANFVSVNITSSMLNVTNSQGVMRNPDGTFYRGDAFEISYHISVTGAALPSNIITTASFVYQAGSLDLFSNSNNIAQFVITQNSPYAPFNLTTVPYLFNEVGNMKIEASAAVSSSQPFAVVEYHPLFAYFTYMEYNNLNSSTYARPFITLVRYDGNAPGYSYSGDANTDPFNAYNSTMERAFINNFTFSTDGWSVQPNSAPSISTSAVNYVEHGDLDVRVQMLNRTYPGVITFSSIYKFYFKANLSSLINNHGIIYFNITESAWYSQGASIHYSDFNTSYLYEPIFYNGYLVFTNNDPANGFNVSVVAHNPDSLNAYLVQKVVGIFGNDSHVVNDFEPDLYAAYSTMELKPIFANATEVMFLVNQTNIMTSSSAQMPYFTISVRGLIGMTTYQYNPSSYLGQPAITPYASYGNITYDVNDEYSLFVVADFSPPAPFSKFTGYFLAEPAGGYEVVMQPMNFSFTGSPASYLMRTYGYPQGPFFVTEEPGNLTQDYAMLYGQNVTVQPNFAGGGITSLVVSREGSIFYVATVFIGNESGGVSSIAVTSNSGQVLYNETIASNGSAIVSFNPQGFSGAYTFEFPVYSNGTVSIDLNGAWGALNTIADIPVTSNYGAPAPSGITEQIMGIVWYLFVPVLFVFWFVVVWFKLKTSGGTSTPSNPWWTG